MQLSTRFDQALSHASELHRSQVRQGTQIPYISHLLAVSSLVIENGGTEDEAIAALLHDGPEDQGGLPILERIRSHFGDNVANIILECSDSLVDTTAGEKKESWEVRKERYLLHLETASPSTLLVSACDKLHNLKSILADYRVDGDALWSRFSRGQDKTLPFYKNFAKAVRRRTSIKPELERIIDEFDRTLFEERTVVRGVAGQVIIVSLLLD